MGRSENPLTPTPCSSTRSPSSHRTLSRRFLRQRPTRCSQEGGKARKPLSSVLTKPGSLAPIMAMRLVDLDAKTVEACATEEAK